MGSGQEWVRELQQADEAQPRIQAPFIETATGLPFRFHCPIELITIEDIAHALSNICRFAGHPRKFYSVAQHSCLVHDYVAEHGGGQREQYSGLLHDAAEAYTGDIPRPWKQLPAFAGIVAIEQELQARIFVKFLCRCAPIVKEADHAVLAAEARDFMSSAGDGWKEIIEPPWPKAKIVPLEPKEAKREFLKRFKALYNEETHCPQWISGELQHGDTPGGKQ